MEDQIVLVDEKDQIIGTAKKMAVHKEGLLHRAFSVLVFNSKGELLLQKRAKNKYHSGGLWTNTCCSHPRLGETVLKAAERRLSEEVGLSCSLKEIFSFRYQVSFPSGLTENELDHVLIGVSDGLPNSKREEAEELRWVGMKILESDLRKNPPAYTYWFRLIMEKFPSVFGIGCLSDFVLDVIRTTQKRKKEVEEEKLIRENLYSLKRYIFSKVSDFHDAEEILQETLISAHESFAFFERKSSFLTWLCGIANHEIADFYRRKRIKTILFSRFPFLENIISEALTPDENIEKEELRKEVKHILSSLTEGYRQILRLKYYQGLSMIEIARSLKTTVKAVESRLSRAREAFRLEWQKAKLF